MSNSYENGGYQKGNMDGWNGDELEIEEELWEIEDQLYEARQDRLEKDGWEC